MYAFGGLFGGKTHQISKLMETITNNDEKSKKNYVLFILLFLAPGTMPGAVTGVQEINIC